MTVKMAAMAALLCANVITMNRFRKVPVKNGMPWSLIRAGSVMFAMNLSFVGSASSSSSE